MQHINNKLKTNIRFHKIAATVLLSFCMFLCNSVWATNYAPTIFTDPDYTAVNNATGVITAGAGTGSISLRSALQAADNNGAGPHTITLSAGTYNVVGGPNTGTYIIFGSNAQNITINGAASPLSSIINMAGAGAQQDRIFAINVATGGLTTNVNITINNVKFTNGHLNSDPYGGGAIEFASGGPASSLTLTGCDFTNNTIDAAAGTTGGAVNYSGSGNFTVTNSTFTGNTNDVSDGGAIYYFFNNNFLAGTMTVTGCTFTNNSATAAGGGSGGAIGIAAQGRIAPFTQVFTANIQKNTFINNTAPGGEGGAVIVDNGDAAYTVDIHFNRFNGNTSSNAATSGLGKNVSSGALSATNNWWGSNIGPAAVGAGDNAAIVAGPGGGALDISTWLQLKATASPAQICTGATSVVTASFLSNSAGTAVSTANLSTVIGLPISFPSVTLGTLSGAQTTIQASGTATVTYTAGAAGGTGTVNAVVDVVPNNDPTAKASIFISKPVVGNPGVTTGTVNSPFSQTFTMTGGVAPGNFTTASTLPAGLTLSSAGVLSGTPTVVGTFPIVVNVTDNIGCTGTGTTYTLVIACQTITVTNPAVTTGTIGTAFSQAFTQTNAIGAVAFTTASTLPTGLTLSGAGLLSGTPTQTGTFPIVVTVTDGNGCTGTSATYNLVISCQTITVTKPVTTTGTVNTAFSQNFTQTGGSGTTTFSTASVLPAGLTLATNGTLSGTPTQTGSFPIVVTATDANGCTGTSSTYTLVISCQTITVNNPAVTSGGLNVPFSQTFTQTNGIGAGSYTLNSGVLPTGLTLASNGTLSGTPTQQGSFPITVKFTDANGCTGISATYNLSIAVSPCNLNQVSLIGTSANVLHNNTISGFTVPGGTNRMLVVTASDANSTTITGVTYNGNPMTAQAHQTDGTAVDAIYTYPLGTNINSSPGNTIVVTSGSVDQTVTASVFESVDQTTPISTVTGPPSGRDSTFSGATGSNLTVASTVKDLVFDIFDYYKSTTAPSSAVVGAGQVFITNQGPETLTSTGGFAYYSTSYKNASAGSTNVSRTTTNGEALIQIAVDIKSAPPVSITVTNPAVTTGQQNVAFSQTFTASGGTPAYVFTTSSTLPAGITLSTAGVLAGTPTATGTFPIIVTATDANGCFANSATYTLVISACPVITVTNPATTTGTAGTAFSQTFTSTGGAGAITYSTASTLPTGLTLSAAGVLSGTPTQTGTFSIVVTATDINSCTGTGGTYNLVISCPAAITGTATPASQTICNGTAITSIVLAGAPVGAVYNWTRDNTVSVTGIAASGAGNISGTLTNAGTAPVTVTFTITPLYYGSCSGTPYTATVTVNPTPDVVQAGPQTLCAGSSSTAVNFSSVVTGGSIVYNWTGTIATIGLPAGGTGNIASFTAVNGGTTVLTDTIKVIASYTNGGTTCTGPVMLFVITVNPTATVTPVPDQTVCNGAPVSAITLSGPVAGTVFNWTNNNTATGLAASGNGNIASFTGTNATNAPITSIVTVTPVFYNQSIMGSLVAGDLTMPNRLFRDGVPGACPTKAFPGTSAGSHLYDTYSFVNTTGQAQCVTVSYVSKTTGDVFVSAYNGSFNPAALATNYLSDGGLSSIGGSVSGFTVNVAAGATLVLVVNEANSAPCPQYIISLTGIGQACTGTPKTFNITVNPTATVNAVANQTICNNAPTAAVNFSGAVSGTVYNWTNNTPSIGLAASGSGDILPFTATNAGTAPVTATITVTPTYTNNGVSCSGTPVTFDITVNPTATVTAVSNQVVCNNSATAAVTFSSPTTGGAIVYNWTNSTPSIGLAASGIGNIASFTATNATNAPLVGTIVVTPSYTNNGVTCTGTPLTFTITVNPTAGITPVAAQTVCNGAPTAAVNFSSSATGGSIVYNWTNSTPSIGLAASGTGNIASFTATNATASPVTATITVTPSYTNGGTTCAGTATTFIITVEPTATVNAVASQTVCNNSPTAAVTLSGPVAGAVYTWTNSAPSIGLAASGVGNIASFTGTNATNAPVTGTITVTPTYYSQSFSGSLLPGDLTNTIRLFRDAVPAVCGTPKTYPGQFTANILYDTYSVTNTTGQAQCVTVTYQALVAGDVFVTAYNGSFNPAALATNYLADGGTSSSVGAGSILQSFSFNVAAGATTVLVANTSTTGGSCQSYNITVSGIGIGCAGTTSTFGITVNPTATVTAVANQVVCNGANTTAVTFSSPTTGGSIVYNWTNSTPSIGLAAGGSGNIASFTATNATAAPVTATITVTPSYTNGGTTCVGTATTFTITVNPTATVNAVANQVVCNNAPTTAVTFSSPTTGGSIAYNWTNNTPSIGLAASGAGNIASFTATNATTAPVTATITVTPAYTNGGATCTGTPRTFTITVNPTATVTAVANQVVCNNSPTAAVTFSSPTTGGSIVYNWTNSTPSIGLAASGAGNIASFTATNATTAPVSATITVTPAYTNGGVTCTGTPRTFTITVNPTATINAVANQVVCNNSPTAAVTFSSPTTGGSIVYNWTNNTPSIGLAASGAGNIASFAATNATNAPVIATITVTPAYTNGGVTCTGTPITFTITVNPTATVTAVANQVVCNNSPTTAVTFTSPTTGGSIVYNWTNNTPSIGLAASGAGNIASFNATNATTAPVTATITVTPAYTNGGVTCTGTPRTFTITVNPTATVTAVANQVVCNNAPTTAVNFSSPTTGGSIVYNWTNNTTSIGLAASGAGNIASFNATNATTGPVTATITVTPAYTNGGVTCTGTPITFTITVNPTSTVNAVANQVVCNNSPTTAVTFSSPTTGGSIVYNWTNSAPSIGLAASGNGNIASFNATNITTAPVTATITVTPAYTNGGVTCTGTPRTFTITVNPTATVTPVANQTVCHNSPTAAVTFSSPTTGGTIVYNWTNSLPSIGLAASGTGNIPSFTAINTGAAAVTATITVTPTYTNGSVSCTGTPLTFTITVNTLSSAPTGATTSAPIICGSGTVTLTAVGGFLGTGAQYVWYTGSCGGSLLGFGQSITVPIQTTTTYFVRIEGVCNITTCSSVTVTVAPQPAVVITAVRVNGGIPVTGSNPGTQIILSATVSPAGNYTYQWQLNGINIPGATSDTLKVPVSGAAGSYTVTVQSVGTPCTALSNTIVLHDAVTTQMFIVPNPSNGIFKVSVYSAPGTYGTQRSLMVFDSKGARVFIKQYSVSMPYNLIDVDISRYARGVYHVTIVDGSGHTLASAEALKLQ